jgi:hypothetical protein
MTTLENVLAFRPREHYADSVQQQRPRETPGRLLVFPTWDPAMDSMLAWAAREDLETFLRWRRPEEAPVVPTSDAVEPERAIGEGP